MNKQINEELMHKFEIVLILLMKIFEYVHHLIKIDFDDLKKIFQMNIIHE